MILRLALRSLLYHPVRAAVLACGFGCGVAVMATLLGVGEVILEQARAPALRGGGDVVVAGAAGSVGSARHVLGSVLGAPPLKDRVAAAAPSTRGALYLVRRGRVVPLRARGGIPSLERALGDPETAAVADWADTPADARWAKVDAADVLRAMDRFHPVPDVPARAGSWAEWLYFNGRSGDTQVYVTFLVGPQRPGGRRIGGVRLQLDRGGRLRSFAEAVELDEAEVLARAPDLAIGGSRVRLDGLVYRLTLDLPSDPSSGDSSAAETVGRGTRGAGSAAPGGRNADLGRGRLSGELSIAAVAGRSLPPITIRGAGGWFSGYVVPAMSGRLDGTLLVDGERLELTGGTGYHDHNWGFWKGVTWQWGQVQHGGLSFVYGRVHPPADAADPARIPGFLAALGPQGPVGYATDVTIEETGDRATGRPQRIVVRGRGASLDLTMELAVEDAVVTRMAQDAVGGGMDFLQLRALYRVAGTAGGHRIDFTAPGAAESFRGN